MTKEKNIHYVNNRDFSQAVVEYCQEVKVARDNNNRLPIVPNYIAQCFLKIAEGLSHKANFIRYTYREEMVMDAVENCLKAIENYNIEAATRTGTPNAFAYFTQISWYAFLRRIQKEKKQQDIKIKYIINSNVDNFIEVNDDINQPDIQYFVDTLKDRIDKVKIKDIEVKEFVSNERRKERIRRKKGIMVDSDLEEFLQ